LENELWQLHRELVDKRYDPGKYHNFKIYEPKERIISAAPYRDRIVHHAIHNVLEPIFEPTFIYDSYATRKGKGTHAAIDRFQQFSRKNIYVLKCDVQKYFPSVDHSILMGLIKRKVGCSSTIWLIDKILSSHCNDDRGRMPIGNLTSQFFANIYLNGMDHFIKENLRCKYYVRYMDDFVIFHNDKQFLWHVKREVEKYLGMLKLRLHDSKCRVFKTENGVPFLGMLVFPDKRRLKRTSIVRFKRRLKKFQTLHKNNMLALPHIIQSIRAWIGHAIHANTAYLRKLVIENIVF